MNDGLEDKVFYDWLLASCFLVQIGHYQEGFLAEGHKINGDYVVWLDQIAGGALRPLMMLWLVDAIRGVCCCCGGGRVVGQWVDFVAGVEDKGKQALEDEWNERILERDVIRFEQLTRKLEDINQLLVY